MGGETPALALPFSPSSALPAYPVTFGLGSRRPALRLGAADPFDGTIDRGPAPARGRWGGPCRLVLGLGGVVLGARRAPGRGARAFLPEPARPVPSRDATIFRISHFSAELLQRPGPDSGIRRSSAVGSLPKRRGRRAGSAQVRAVASRPEPRTGLASAPWAVQTIVTVVSVSGRPVDRNLYERYSNLYEDDIEPG